MASINDVYNQLVAVNGNLGQIHADGIAETNAIGQVKASVDNLDSDTKAGFAATLNALHTIALVDIEAVKLLYHLTQQADAMICELQNISRNTCQLLNEATVQTGLQKDLDKDVDALRALQESAHPEAELERQRLAEIRKETERCCPPPVTPPACSYQPCPAPKPAEPPHLPRIDNPANQ